MKKLSLLTLAAVLTHNVNATLIDAWDFASLAATTVSTATPSTIAATIGSGSLDVSAFGLGSPQGTNPERTSFGGTATVNAFAGGEAVTGTALALANSSANGKSLVFSFSMLGFQDLVVTFAGRGTASGFNSGVWAWSTDGASYSTLVGVNTATTSTSFALQTIDLSAISDLDNDSSVFLKYTLSGATTATGNNRIDNIQFNATTIAPVPEPSAVALAAAGGFALLFAYRRRR